MRPPEWIALVYFGYVAASAATGPFTRRRARVLVSAALTILLIVVLAQGNARPIQRVRDWMPGLYAVLGYWFPGQLAGAPHARLERWLRDLDRPLLPAVDTLALRAPRLVLEYLELAYLCCYPLVPCAFVWLALHGWIAAADRYWTVVLLALYPCYGPVAWIPTRPPRALEPAIAVERRHLALRALNLRVLRGVSIQLNTFPSGHTAGALAAAAVVATMMPVSGAVVAAVAISIAVSSVVGRYHYAADALAGAGVAVVAFACGVWWFGD